MYWGHIGILFSLDTFKSTIKITFGIPNEEAGFTYLTESKPIADVRAHSMPLPEQGIEIYHMFIEETLKAERGKYSERDDE